MSEDQLVQSQFRNVMYAFFSVICVALPFSYGEQLYLVAPLPNCKQGQRMHIVGIQETAKGITVKRTHDGGVESQFHT